MSGRPAITSASFARMLPLWSITSPTVTGISSCRNKPDGLPDPVFVNLEILLAQIGDIAAFSVAHGSVASTTRSTFTEILKIVLPEP